MGQYWADGSAEHRQASRSYLDRDGLRGQYLSGVQDPSRIDPDNWVIDKALIYRQGVDEIMLDLLYDIRTQVPVFKAMQQFLRDRRPPTLVATGANDEIFPEQAVRQILTDHPGAEYHALDTGHFALEDKAAEIAALMRDFLARTVPPASRLERPTAARPRTPGRHSGEPERADREVAPLIERSHCAEPKSVSLIRELFIEGTHDRARPGRSEDLT